MQRLFSLVFAVLVVLLPLSGCGPALSEKDLGVVQESVPVFPAQEEHQEGAKKASKTPTKPSPVEQSKQPAAKPAAESPK